MKICNALGFIVATVLLAAVGAPADGGVRVTNFKTGETVRFPVVLIRGEMDDADITSVSVAGGGVKWSGLALKGRFKTLVELRPGVNKLAIFAGESMVDLTLNYKPQTNGHVVRVFYFVDKSGDTRFQTLVKDDRRNWRGKLGTAMKLMQTFTAQRLGEAGFGRKTFNLELDDKGRVKVHILKGRRSGDEYRKLNGNQLYSEARAELIKQFPNKRAKNLVIPAFTRFDPKTGKVAAHTALGGGNMALFGGGDLFTWPDSIGEAQAAFMNAARVDPKKIFSDSIGRHTFWANASTTMGAALHEIGHTFGLPHSRDAQDIMTRGHDRFNRFFTMIEPPHAGQKTPCEFKDNHVAYWAPVSAGRLAPSRFFALDNRDWKTSGEMTTVLNVKDGKLTFGSAFGVRYVGVWCLTRGGTVQSITPGFVSKNGKAPRKVTLDITKLKKELGDINFKFFVTDDEGLSSTVMLSALMARASVKPAATPK
ncbi:MAG: hypothetical protein HN350_11110 [Phycisphaerales bacterium]|nr:hypothetical protein [Phycisphaerales bacterium]